MDLPIILFVYNRVEHVKLLLKSLKMAEGFEDVQLFIFSDSAKEERDVDRVEEVRNLCREFCGCSSKEIIERSSNYGLARNIIDGVGYVLSKFECAVILEDDLVVSPYFIKYFKQALNFYKDKNVFSISAYTPNIDIPQGYDYATYAMKRNCSWGWATWREKWARVDWEVNDFDRFIRNSSQRREFNKCGTDLSPMLLRWKIGEINSWSIRFCYAGFCCNEPTIYPSQSLVKNCGVDGSGTNMKKSFRYDTSMVSYIDCNRFLPEAKIDDRILISFRKIYNTSLFRRIVNMLKRIRYILFI